MKKIFLMFSVCLFSFNVLAISNKSSTPKNRGSQVVRHSKSMPLFIKISSDCLIFSICEAVFTPVALL